MNKKKTEAFDYCLKLLALRDRSEKEITDKLALKKYTPDEIQVALEKLKLYNYINDEKFAEQFVRFRLGSGKSINYIKKELFRKGIDRQIIEETVRRLKPSAEEESKTAFSLALKKFNKKLSPEKNASRISGFLARRGYDWDVISAVIKKIEDDTRG